MIITLAENAAPENDENAEADNTENTEAENTDAAEAQATEATEAENAEAEATEAENTEAQATSAENAESENTEAQNAENAKAESPEAEATDAQVARNFKNQGSNFEDKFHPEHFTQPDARPAQGMSNRPTKRKGFCNQTRSAGADMAVDKLLRQGDMRRRSAK